MSTLPPADGYSDQGKVYRSRRRPGLTSPGVVVFSLAVALVAALISILVTDGLGWIYSVPFILVSAYCAAEVREDSRRTALVTPPLVMLAVALLTPWVTGDAESIRGSILRALTVLTKMAPTLLAAVLISAAILWWRHWRARRSGAKPAQLP